MFYIPSYIREEQNENGLVLKSLLLENEICLNENKYIEEYQNIRKNGTSQIVTELEKFLHEQEMLCDISCIKEINMKLQNIISKKMILTLMPTEACNFRCPYCYEEHDNVHMTPGMISAIKRFVDKNIEYIDTLNISWFGGEPTLRRDIIKDVSEYVLEVIKKKNKMCMYAGSMTTNGYLLTSERVKEFWGYGIKCYQITLDGFNHDKTRPLVNGAPTLEVILNNLKEISSLPEEYDFSIILRRNILPGDSTEWYNYLNKLFGNDRRFSLLVRAVSDWGGNNIRDMKILEENEREHLLEEHKEYIKSLQIASANKAIDEVWNPVNEMCYAAYPKSYVFRANGDIEKCTISLGEKTNIIGYIDEKNDVQIDEEINRIWSREGSINCEECRNLLGCSRVKCPKVYVIEKTK